MSRKRKLMEIREDIINLKSARKENNCEGIGKVIIFPYNVL